MSYPNNDPENTSAASNLPPSFPEPSGSSAHSPADDHAVTEPVVGQGNAEQPHHSPYPTAQQHMVSSGPVYGASPQQQVGYYPQPGMEQSWAWAPKWALGMSIFNVAISLIPILNIIVMSVTSVVGLVLCILALVGISKDPRASKNMAIISVALFLLSGVTLVLSYVFIALLSSV